MHPLVTHHADLDVRLLISFKERPCAKRTAFSTPGTAYGDPNDTLPQHVQEPIDGGFKATIFMVNLGLELIEYLLQKSFTYTIVQRTVS